MNPWNSPEEKLPEVGQIVLAKTKNNAYMTYLYKRRNGKTLWQSPGGSHDGKHILCWMAIPSGANDIRVGN